MKLRRIRKTFYVNESLIDELKEIARNENTNQTLIYNEFIEFALHCYRLTERNQIKNMRSIYEKGIDNYIIV